MGADGLYFDEILFKKRKEHKLFSFRLGLREMLLSEEHQLMKPEHRNKVYQDMTKPLTDYWINTSHNT